MSESSAPPVPAGPRNETGPIPPYFGPMGRTAQAPQPRPAEGVADQADPVEAPGPAGATAAGATAVGSPGSGAPDSGVPTTQALAAQAPMAEAPTVEEPAVSRPDGDPADGPVAAWALTGDPSPDGPDLPPTGTFPTTPVTTRPTVRARRRDPLTRMGPWAPAAGALLGLLAGLLVVAVLAGRADAFGEGLALVFLVVGLTMLGAAGALLADEVRLVRRGAREAAVRPAWVEATAGLLNGLTPARLLLASSAFVLFLAAYVGR